MRSTGVEQQQTRTRAVLGIRRHQTIRGYGHRRTAAARDVLHAWVGAVDIGVDRVARFARVFESLPRETTDAPVRASALFAMLAARGREVVQDLDRRTSRDARA